LDLPVIVGEPIPVLYVQMDGTGVPVVKKETAGRQGKTEGQPAHTREAKLVCVFTQSTWDNEGFAIREPDSTTYTGAIERQKSLASAPIDGQEQATQGRIMQSFKLPAPQKPWRERFSTFSPRDDCEKRKQCAFEHPERQARCRRCPQNAAA